MYKKKRIFFRISKNLSSLIMAQIIYKIFTFFTMILIARFLDVQGFGVLSFGLSFVWIFLFLSDFGLAELFVRDATMNNSLLKKYTDNMMGAKITLSLIAYLILVITGKVVSGNDALKFTIINILGLSIILDSFVYYFRSVFRIKNIIHYEALLIIIEAMIKLSTIFLAVIANLNIQKTIIISLALLAVSSLNFLINMSVFFRYNKLSCLKFEKKLWGYFFKTGFIFALVYILSLINFRIDIIMLSRMRGDIDAGLFSANLRIIEQFLLLPAVLSYVILPEFLRLSGSIRHLYSVALKLILGSAVLSFIIIIFCFIFSRDMIKIIYGTKFLQATACLKIMSLILPFFFINVIIEKIIYSYGRQLYVSFIYAVCVLLNIILNIIAIPKFGIFGASFTTIISEIFMMLGIIFCFRKYVLGVHYKKKESMPTLGLEYLND